MSLAVTEVACFGSGTVLAPTFKPGGAVILGLVMGKPLLLAVVMEGSGLRCMSGASLSLTVVTVLVLGLPDSPCCVAGVGEREAGMGGESTGDKGTSAGLLGEKPS